MFLYWKENKENYYSRGLIMTYTGMDNMNNRKNIGRAIVLLCFMVFMVLGFGRTTQADERVTEETVSAYAVYAGESELTYVKDEASFQKLVNSVETYFSKVGEGEKLVSVEFRQSLQFREAMVSVAEVKTSVEALGIIVRNMKSAAPALTVTVTKDVAREEEIPYEVEYLENKKMYEGTQKIKQKGYNGTRYIEGMVTEENGQEVQTQIVREDIISEPVTEVVEEGTKENGNGTGKLIVPTNGGYLSSGFGQRDGRMHKGIDIARPDTYTIMAADTGRVIFAGNDGGYGNKVVVDHGNGMKTVYAHLASITVKSGQTVEQGKRIGVMGRTGWATGVHLHFEVIVNGAYKNPASYINI